MTRLPRLKGKELIRILERAGFQAVRTGTGKLVSEHISRDDVERTLSG